MTPSISSENSSFQPGSALHLYTDGSYLASKKLGGWSAVLFNQTECLHSIYGSQAGTSSLQMELTAALKGLEFVLNHFDCPVILHTDSKILLEGIEYKIKRYRHQEWRHKSGRPVPFQPLWEALDKSVRNHSVSVRWVKGHHRSKGNQMADRLARQALFEKVE